MASLESSNRNLPFYKIPKLNAFLKSVGKAKPSRPGVEEYALWFNTYADQIRPYHSLNPDDRFSHNDLNSLKQAYLKILPKIEKEKQAARANGEFYIATTDVAMIFVSLN